MSLPAAPSCSAPSGPITPAEIDASFRVVALCTAAKSAFWLLVGSLICLLASVKLHGPGMLSGSAWLTYGRLAPAGWNAIVYGFAAQTGIALGLWVLARAAGQRLQSPLLVVAGGILWNLGVLAGVIGVLAGYSTGREWLEMPASTMAILVIGAGLMGTAGWVTFSARTNPDPYPSAWFVLVALLSFVWFGTVALMSYSGGGVTGVVQVLVQRWYVGGILKLGLGGLALGVIFHFLPLAAGRPLASRQMALVGFWALVFFAPWAVTGHGDPFPRWIISAGIAGQMLATVGWLAIALNWWKTVEGTGARVFAGLPGRLIGAAAVAYVLAGALQFVVTLQGAASVVRFTWMASGLEWLFVGGVAILAFLGALPVFIEQATGRRLAPALVGAHAWLSLVGVGVIAISLILAGWVQGVGLSSVDGTFIEVLRRSMNLVRLSSLGFTFFLLAQLVWVATLIPVFRGLVTEALGRLKEWAAPLPAKGAVRS